jgi:hypothetical protein
MALSRRAAQRALREPLTPSRAPATRQKKCPGRPAGALFVNPIGSEAKAERGDRLVAREIGLVV